MATTTESSVLMNLNGLFEIEAERRAEEAAAKERARAAEVARLEAERREREAALAAAREDERARLERERAERDAEVEARIEGLRAELGEVRAARERMRLEVAELGARPAARSRKGSWLASVMAAASLVAAITATTVAWPRHEVVADAPATPVQVVEQVVDAPAPAPEVAPSEVEAPVVTAAAPAPAPAARPSRPRRPRPPRAHRPDNLASQLDGLGGGDERDVLGREFLDGAGR